MTFVWELTEGSIQIYLKNIKKITFFNNLVNSKIL